MPLQKHREEALDLQDARAISRLSQAMVFKKTFSHGIVNFVSSLDLQRHWINIALNLACALKPSWGWAFLQNLCCHVCLFSCLELDSSARLEKCLGHES
jgi:hypothetical protein